ncbi:MAG TPA: HupE/UreJ family protein [Kofleriaceae bacterium]
MRAAVLVAWLILAIPPRAWAHQTSVKYVDVELDGAQLRVQLSVAPGDVTEPLGLRADARPGVAAAATPAVAAYVARWLAIGPPGAPPCPATAAAAAPGPEGRFVVVEWRARCDRAPAAVALDFTAFFAVDPGHEAIVTVHAPGDTGEPRVIRADQPIARIAFGDTAGLAGWIAAGVEHIWDGRDHVCFVLALLLVVMLARDPHGWSVRGPVATLRRTAAIITSFTIAHSLSLVAASLGWVRLPGAFVESLIAFSILYTAIENIIRPDVRWRFALTFGFGLVHGLGFASVLRERLPPDHVVAPLFAFNLGVELGQLVIVAIALPLAWLAARELGAERYRRRVLPALSLALAAVALKWLIERVFGVALGGFWGL